MSNPSLDYPSETATGEKRRGRRVSPRIARLTAVPEGSMVELPGRGSTYVVDLAGPTPDSPTVLLLHGMATTAMLNWFPSLRELNERYRVVLFDQRWHGHGIRSERFDLDDLADDALALAEVLGVDRPILAGYSLGGVVAQLAAHRNPDKVGGIVLTATTYRFQETRRERAFHKAWGLMIGSMAEYATRRTQLHDEKLQMLPQSSWPVGRMDRWAMSEMRSTSGWALAQALVVLGQFDSSEWLSTLKVPAAVLITTRDRALPVYRQLEMAKAIPGAEIFLAKAGHAACALEADVFVPVLLEAVQSVAERL
ncbi:alpha/beta fold hydrolase [Nocardia sp. SYP-A9097]|uniref:alpha/beta fold hydrolase n=1 Tax=Nocardia sp. SYP-A9097 TaxID=2663237 RepID=UPI00129A16ED|nr:alpha/beta hydrolase [Nocardia sp. SYP-A9097]MRH92729.1 alpha/beta fold hydrolase [Nocardia sp. SYP-A9097]